MLGADNGPLCVQTQRPIGWQRAKSEVLMRPFVIVLALIAGVLALGVSLAFPAIAPYLDPSVLTHVDLAAVQAIALRVIGAACVFAALLYAARVLQSVLRRSILTPGRIDQGIAYAIEKAVGYAGLAFAIIYAASILGLDLSGLTVVAGALSVGIGFGLQTVITNFVCGIIVLIERPIRLGDWVVVKDFQGIVRRINVRSTEIETFEGASVLIPNSEFITGTVKNWMLGSPGGRVSITVRTATETDPDLVLAVLRRVAQAYPGIDQTKAPFVSFDGFSGDGLDFTLDVAIADIGRGGGIKSDLRSMVLKAFREARIGLPAPAMDWQKGQSRLAAYPAE
jgi:potassium-dependent mechanosensitive channel